MLESFKLEYKGEDDEAGMQPRKIRTERLRQEYGRSFLARREAVGLAKTNEGSSNSMKRSREEVRQKSRRERIR